MESSIEKLEGLAHKLTVEIPAETIDQAVIQRLKEIRPRIRLDGFRPGKVPPHIVKQRYGSEARQDVLSAQIETAYRDAIQASEYDPVAPPQVELISGFKEGEPLKFSAVFEIMPEIEVKGLNDLAITLPKSEVTEQDIDEMVETLRKQQSTFSETDKTAENNDRVTVDFIGRLDGEEFEGGKGEDTIVTLGSGQMLPDFEAGLLGSKSDEEKTFDVTFPEDYPSEKLAGKTAQFTVKVKKVEQMDLPELDEAFIRRFGIEAGDLEAFKNAIRENMARELENAHRRIKRERMFDALLEKNGDLTVPNSVLQQEMTHMAKEMELDKRIADAEKRQQLIQEIFAAPAKRRIQLGYLLGKLFEERKITLDQARVDARLESIAATYEDPEEVKTWYRNDKNARVSLESAVLEEQLIDQLYEQANVSQEEKTFQEMMAINSQIAN